MSEPVLRHLENLLLILYATSEGSDKSAHQCKLARASTAVRIVEMSKYFVHNIVIVIFINPNRFWVHKRNRLIEMVLLSTHNKCFGMRN